MNLAQEIVASLLTLRSPKGGRTLRTWGGLQRATTVNTPETLVDYAKPEPGPKIVEDYAVYHVGYCGKCSAKIFVRNSVAEFLYRRFGEMFGR